MSLTTPGYIQKANIQDPKITYVWDDGNTEGIVNPLDREFLSILRTLPIPAVGTFTCALAEWVVHRFKQQTDVSLPEKWLEAVWAGWIDIRYIGKVWEEIREEKEWRGAVKGPVDLAMRFVQWTVEDSVDRDGGDPGLQCARLSAVTLNVLPNPTSFNDWKEQIVEKLQRLYIKGAHTEQGKILTRQFFEPEFLAEEGKNLIDFFLKSLNYNKNPFLNSPEKMIEQGFKGTPYTFM